MKKIYWLIIFFLSLILAPQKIGAAQAINISFDPQTAKVGDKITVMFEVSETPAGAVNVSLYISDTIIDQPTGNEAHLKGTWAAPASGASASYQYLWDTQAALSNPGLHYVNVFVLDKDNYIKLNKTETYTLALANSPTPVDSNTPINITSPTPTDNIGGFDLGNLGKISFLPTKINDAKELMAVIINWLLTFVGALAVIALIYSGVMYITAGGDAAKAENAKKNIVWAIVGILIAISALIIVNVIAQAFHG